MNAEPKFNEPEELSPVQNGLLRSTYSPLKSFADEMERLDNAVKVLGVAGGKQTEASTLKLRRQIREFEPSVTAIGQVKAGKTTLTNALVGWPGILPADVNPWTSVVTSLHIDPRAPQSTKRSSFRFFDEDEWGRLVQRGGRVGELAERAGAHQELEKVRKQLEAMREKSRARLGKKFELLMGQQHDYGYFDEELLQRYICLGDDMGGHQEGRFADITKSADLHFSHPDLPHRLCFRDTPGVNDTFMIREQITINAIRESRLCVVVLSAHQALSSVDMALIRLISNIRSRSVIIFVNRIDELQDPVRDTYAIRESIVHTLKAHNGPTDAEIIFGSAHWGVHALKGAVNDLDSASGSTLLKWAKNKWQGGDVPQTIQEGIWELSAVPDLGNAIARRLCEDECADFRARVLGAARNIAEGIQTSQTLQSRRQRGAAVRNVPRSEISQEFDAIAARCSAVLDECLHATIKDLRKRLTQSRKSFLGRATASLVKHLETYGEREVWTYDPAGLRLLLRSGYQVFVKKTAKTAQDVFEQAASEISDLYIGAFELQERPIQLDPPGVPRAPAPVILGSTIALDVRGNWWTAWWRRKRSYAVFSQEFSELIDAELEPIVTSIVTDHAEPHMAVLSSAMTDFLNAQKRIILTLAEQTEIEAQDLDSQVGETMQAKSDMLKMAQSVLSELQKPGNPEEAQ